MRFQINTLSKLCAFASLLICIPMLFGCAGRAANPVVINQFGDEDKSCQVLKNELRTIENNIQRLIPESNKTGRNIALGVAGVFVWPAWLFMDLSSAEKQEINAYRIRYDHLTTIAQSKQCESPIG